MSGDDEEDDYVGALHTMGSVANFEKCNKYRSSRKKGLDDACPVYELLFKFPHF
jgi:hypothetical protein